jgi:hypothetical protein
LAIENKWDWSKTYPVIRIDFAAGSIENRAELDKRVYKILEDNQRRLGLDCENLNSDLAGCFENIIQQAHDSTSSRYDF